MSDDNLIELASRLGGVEGKLGALVETFIDHRKENSEDHTAVMSVLSRMEEKMDKKLLGHDIRINGLEKFRDYAYGVAAVIVFLIGAPHIAQLLIP